MTKMVEAYADIQREAVRRQVEFCKQPVFFELEALDGDPAVLRAVAICNGTAYKGRDQRMGRCQEAVAAALALHSLLTRLVKLMYDQRAHAYEVVRQRAGVRGDVLGALGRIRDWLDRYGRRMEWNDVQLSMQWRLFCDGLRYRLCDLMEIAPASASMFSDNYQAKYNVIETLSTHKTEISDLLGMIPETVPARQLSLF